MGIDFSCHYDDEKEECQEKSENQDDEEWWEQKLDGWKRIKKMLRWKMFKTKLKSNVDTKCEAPKSDEAFVTDRLSLSGHPGDHMPLLG